jgi:site-specific DNA recombinase
MKNRAALYARFSTEKQNEASIADQFRACERVAVGGGLQVVARFEDRGISGGTSDRPGYQALLAGGRSASFDVIVVEDISRLWRNRSDYGQASAELEDRGVHLLTCVGDDTRRDGYGLVLGIKQAIAEHARREISYRTRRGLEGLALAGKSTGGRCYGYAGINAVHKPQAAVVRDIFCRAAAGESAKRIAANLTAPAPRGLIWRPSTVDAILRNVRYTGAVIWGATEGRASAANSRHKRRTVREEGPVVERFDAALQIVPPELFEKVQKERACRTLCPVF